MPSPTWPGRSRPTSPHPSPFLRVAGSGQLPPNAWIIRTNGDIIPSPPPPPWFLQRDRLSDEAAQARVQLNALKRDLAQRADAAATAEAARANQFAAVRASLESALAEAIAARERDAQVAAAERERLAREAAAAREMASAREVWRSTRGAPHGVASKAVVGATPRARGSHPRSPPRMISSGLCVRASCWSFRSRLSRPRPLALPLCQRWPVSSEQED